MRTTITSIIALIIAIVALFVGLTKAEEKRAYTECSKWATMDKIYPVFEWSKIMIEQCASVNYEIEIK